MSGTPARSGVETLRFTPLYQLDDEFAAEIANQTMHGIMHISVVAN